MSSDDYWFEQRYQDMYYAMYGELPEGEQALKTRKELQDRINELVKHEPGTPLELDERTAGYIAALYWVLGDVS